MIMDYIDIITVLQGGLRLRDINIERQSSAKYDVSIR